jgi:hypothetical protein
MVAPIPPVGVFICPLDFIVGKNHPKVRWIMLLLIFSSVCDSPVEIRVSTCPKIKQVEVSKKRSMSLKIILYDWL